MQAKRVNLNPVVLQRGCRGHTGDPRRFLKQLRIGLIEHREQFEIVLTNLQIGC